MPWLCAQFLEGDFNADKPIGGGTRHNSLKKYFYPFYAELIQGNMNIRFLPEASFSLGVLLLPLSVCLSVRPSVHQQVCPRDNSSPVQARITKFGPKMQNTLVKVPIVLGGNQQPSRSNLRSKSKFTPFWACPHHNSSPIQARITKFGPEVQNTSVKIPIGLGCNWPRPSRSNLIWKYITTI